MTPGYGCLYAAYFEDIKYSDRHKQGMAVWRLESKHYTSQLFRVCK